MAQNVQAAQNLIQNTSIKSDHGLQIPQYIDGIPKPDWTTVRKVLLDQMLSQKRFGPLDALTVANGTAAGGPAAAVGGAAAAVVAIYTAASPQVYGLLMQQVLPSSTLHNTLSNVPFTGDAFNTYSMINHIMQKTTHLDQEAVNFNAKWDKATFANSVALTKDGVYKWRDYLISLNRVPAAYRKTENEIVRKFCHNIHPKLLDKAMDLYEANAAANRFPANYPANIFPGGPVHPNAGNPHPFAGQRNIEQYISQLAPRFDTLIEQGSISLPSDISVAAVEHEHANAAFSEMFDMDELMLTESIYSLLEQGYSVQDVQNINRTSRFPRCYNCGGLNHFARKNGEPACSSPENSVPKQILFGIRYPMGAISSGKGKGKGRGKGFGRGRGRTGRANEWVNAALVAAASVEDPQQQNLLSSPVPAAPPVAPVISPPAMPEPEPSSQTVNAADDLDIEDLYSVDYDTSALRINVLHE